VDTDRDKDRDEVSIGLVGVTTQHLSPKNITNGGNFEITPDNHITFQSIDGFQINLNKVSGKHMESSV
jgi:hypothetical protein